MTLEAVVSENGGDVTFEVDAFGEEEGGGKEGPDKEELVDRSYHAACGLSMCESTLLIKAGDFFGRELGFEDREFVHASVNLALPNSGNLTKILRLRRWE